MLKKYVGKNRRQNLDWLADDWLKNGPPVCFLQGFSGVGKSDLARDFRGLAEKQGRWEQAVINEIADRTTPSVLECLMELSTVLGEQGLPEMERVLFEESAPNLAGALEKALRRPVVIILDEAQRLFHRESGSPLPELHGILSFLRNRPALPGRLLLLSDRIVEEARWSEWIPKRTLTKLEPDEALAAFDFKLAEAGVVADIPDERKREVLRDLDYTPRAIEALVAALRHESLDEIIESSPGLWAVRDRVISGDFLNALERDLLARTMRHLDEQHRLKLWQLAVHRRSFKREAIEQFCSTKEELSELRGIFVTRFLLNFHGGVHALHPIVREISLAHLRDDPAHFKRAHSAASDYHSRHFKSKKIVADHGRLGESFAELRYHLVQAGRPEELRQIGERFTQHLRHEIKPGTPVPVDPAELDERIGVLTVLVGRGGLQGLEYHLARCLEARGKSGDLDQALIFAKRAIGPGVPVAHWLSAARITRRIAGVDAALEILGRGRKSVSVENDQYSIFLCGGEFLCGAGRIAEAMNLIEIGIGIVTPERGLHTLYGLLGEYHCRLGQPHEAIAKIREGIMRVPEQYGRHKLAEIAMLLCLGSGDGEQLASIVGGSGDAELPGISIALGRVLLHQHSGDWAAAAEVAKTERAVYAKDVALPAQEAFSRLACGDAEGALAALAPFLPHSLANGGPTAWLAALIHLRRGAGGDAERMLAAYLERPVDRPTESNSDFLLALWDERIAGLDTHRLCFHLPLMPASLTGLNRPIRRVQFAIPVIPVQPVRSPAGIAATDHRAVLPHVYVSYAWGEDSTPDGRRREEIVDRLCEAVRKAGHDIGRDKERMVGGDSIERFAREISKAKRIVAVISEKSLHSDYCMAQELFRAYRRCDYHREEFQEKIIALVMDDAQAIFKDDLSLLNLAGHWKRKFEKLQSALEAIDPRRRNGDLWAFVDLVEEMAPRLPGMLSALKDIVMKRGFDDIVRDGFQEVLARIPARIEP